jgi:hypothetical protein
VKTYKNRPRIVYSADEKFYYIATGEFPRFWLGVEKLPRPEAEAYKGHSVDGAVWFESKTGGESYGRQTLPFNFWKIPGGREERTSAHGQLYKDYRSAQKAGA